MTYDLQFYPEHQIDVGGGMFVAYPPQTTTIDGITLTATVTISDREVDNTLILVDYDQSARAVVITNIIQGDEPYMPTVDSMI